jgi:hypothetical protein
VSAAVGEGFAEGETIALRPDLSLPDWSVLHDATARAALAASMAIAGRRAKWAGLDAAEDALRRAVLRHFAAEGTAPALADLAASTSLPEDGVQAALRTLHRRDLLVLDPSGTRLRSCYPFSAEPTPHLLLLEGSTQPLHALCAIDALGTGGMLGAATEIRSRCPHCAAPITIRTCDSGRKLGDVAPREAVVWSGTRYASGCAASSGCVVKLFFCSDAHLAAWRAAADPAGPGYRLTVPGAMQIGLALFGPMLP